MNLDDLTGLATGLAALVFAAVVMIAQALVGVVVLIVLAVVAMVAVVTGLAGMADIMYAIYQHFVHVSKDQRELSRWAAEGTRARATVDGPTATVLQGQISAGEVVSLWFSPAGNRFPIGVEVDLRLTVPGAPAAETLFTWRHDGEDTGHQQLAATGMSKLETSDFSLIGYWDGSGRLDARWLAIRAPAAGLLRVEATVRPISSPRAKALTDLRGATLTLRAGMPEKLPPQTFSLFARLRERFGHPPG